MAPADDLDLMRGKEIGTKHTRQNRSAHDRSLYVDSQNLRLVLPKDVDLDRPLIFQMLGDGGKLQRIPYFDSIDSRDHIVVLKPELSVESEVVEGFQTDPLRSSVHNRLNWPRTVIPPRGVLSQVDQDRAFDRPSTLRYRLQSWH